MYKPLKIWIYLAYLSLSLAQPAYAKVKIAFLEFYNPQGQLVTLEPGGRFGHVAISYKGGWLHSFPPRPVEWVEDLSQFGKVAEVIEVHRHPNYLEHIIQAELGKPAHVNSEWSDPTTTYCSKLVGMLLGIPPRPSLWEAPVWKTQPNYGQLASEGLSPDDIYEHLLINQGSENTNFIATNSCSKALH